MEQKRKPSSHVFGGVTAPPLDAKAKEAYRKQWGFDPPAAHVLLLPPEYRQKPENGNGATPSHAEQKPKSGAEIDAEKLMAEAKAKKNSPSSRRSA